MSRHHYGARLHRFTDDLGYRRVALENEQIRVEILLDKGASIRSFLHKPTDTEFMWHSPLGLRPAIETIGGDFLDGYEGGWQEIFPNGGPPSRHPSGVELPFHGEAATVPWDLADRAGRAARRSCPARGRDRPNGAPAVEDADLASGVGRPRDRRADVEPVAVPGRADVGPPSGVRGAVPRCLVSVDVPARRASTRRSSPMPGSRLEFGVDFDWPIAPVVGGGSVDLRQVPPAETGAAEWVCLSELSDGWYALTNTDRGSASP